MSDTSTNHLPRDPVKWVRDLGEIWQAKDAKRAAEGFTEDAVQIWGADQRQTAPELLQRPAKWFAYASDLKIDKHYIAHSGNCIVTSWDSTYTHPENGKKMHERGIECFYFRNGKVHEQRVWQHSWADGENGAAQSFSTD